MSNTRTMAEINKDYITCKKYVDDHPDIVSFKEIAKAIGLSESQVQTSLSRHPRVFNGIKKMLASNQETLKAKKRAQKKAEEELKQKAKKVTFEVEEKSKIEEKTKVEQQEIAERNVKFNRRENVDFVIDASISGVIDIMDTINKICNTESKIILTSITIKELEKLQKFYDTVSYNARRILAMAAGDYSHFECALIDETVGCPDDCIIKYCADNKVDVVLLTSDKTMELKARAYGIKTRFFKQNEADHVNTNIKTLYFVKRICGKLLLSDFGDEYRSVRVISNNNEYNNGVVELKMGDDVYIATKRKEYITFAHYRIISLDTKNNCKVIYSKRIYDLTEINNLPKADYKSFMRDFKRKINL